MQKTVSENKRRLALNMIVGPGEAADLARCLKTFEALSTFDEIVIVNTSNDSAIDAVANEYGAKLLRKEWTSERYPYGDFGGARQMALDATESEWVMWLDADDVCLKEHREKLQRVRERVLSDEAQEADVFFMRYTLVFDETGSEVVPFMRDRIWRRQPRFRWVRPVHEGITPSVQSVNAGEINGVSVTHMPGKPGATSSERNLRILEHEIIHNGDTSPEMRFFYCRDLMEAGRLKDARAELEKLLIDMVLPTSYLFMLCMTMALKCGFNGVPLRPSILDIKDEKIPDVEHWLRMAISVDAGHPEPLVLLGDIYLRRGLIDTAKRLYSLAMKKDCSKSRTITIAPFYKELPASRLAEVNESIGEFDAALFYNRMAIRENIHEAKYWIQRRNIIERLQTEVQGVLSAES